MEEQEETAGALVPAMGTGVPGSQRGALASRASREAGRRWCWGHLQGTSWSRWGLCWAWLDDGSPSVSQALELGHTGGQEVGPRWGWLGWS